MSGLGGFAERVLELGGLGTKMLGFEGFAERMSGLRELVARMWVFGRFGVTLLEF